MFWKGKKVLVTGGAGFIGSHVVEKLLKYRANVTILDNLQRGKRKNIAHIAKDCLFVRGDCRDISTAKKACKGKDIVLNLAARVRGIEYNKAHQATMLSDNLLIETVMIEVAKQMNVERFLIVSSACVYPQNCSVPTPESEGFLDEPEAANGGYGWAKRMNEKLGQYYQEEFDMQVSIVRPYNCYGPRDHFDPPDSHVIPALIKRVFAGENPVTVWGSGKQSRAFLFVEDLAEGMLLATEKYTKADPINLGCNEEVTMKDLITMIINLSGKNLPIYFDITKPDGSLRRNSDNHKAEEKIGFIAKTKLQEGLKKTINWYKKRASSL